MYANTYLHYTFQVLGTKVTWSRSIESKQNCNVSHNIAYTCWYPIKAFLKGRGHMKVILQNPIIGDL